MRNALLVFAFLTSVTTASAQSPTIPETPAGHLLGGWLEAFNRGDRTTIRAFHERYNRPEILDGVLSFRNQTGGVG